MGVKSYTDQQLIKRVETTARGFEGWKKGVYDVWVRSHEDVTDAFDDKVYTFNVPAEGAIPEFRMVCTGTSNAGSYGLKRFKDYNPEGCAVLESDRIVYGSHAYGFHKNYRAYRQVRPFPYYRDNDLDGKAEELGRVHNDIIFANCHRAAAAGESTRIYNWSVACLVRNKANQWNAWLAYMNERPLSVCILKEF
jgi:hypothetical protein